MRIDTGRLIIRIDFLNKYSYVDSQGECNGSLYEFVSEIFPVAALEHSVDAQVDMNLIDSGSIGISKSDKLNNFTFRKQNINSKIVLNEKSIILDLDAREEFLSYYKSEIVQFIKIIRKANSLQILKTKRIGVRCILNNEKVTLENSNEIFKENFISNTFFLGDKVDGLVQSTNIFDLKYEEISLRFIHGYLNKNFPSKTGQFTYVVDIDGYHTKVLTGYDDIMGVFNDIKAILEDFLPMVYKDYD